MSRMPQENFPNIARQLYQAALLDMDGVITDTASIHAACWKTMFDQFLEEWSSQNVVTFRPFDAADYNTYVDGKPRNQGVRDFLKSRAITLADGMPMDSPSSETVCGLGNRKNELVNARLATNGADAYPGSVGFVLYLRRMGIKTAIVTSSENCEKILKAAKVEDLFDACVDGEVLIKERLTGKPAPDAFLRAAELLQVRPQRALVVEDAISGVRAGRAGGFGLVIGVNRKNNAEELKQNGADIVVNDLSELFTKTLPQQSALAA